MVVYYREFSVVELEHHIPARLDAVEDCLLANLLHRGQFGRANRCKYFYTVVKNFEQIGAMQSGKLLIILTHNQVINRVHGCELRLHIR